MCSLPVLSRRSKLLLEKLVWQLLLPLWLPEELWDKPWVPWRRCNRTEKEHKHRGALLPHEVSALWCSYWRVPDDGDFAVVDDPPAGVIQSCLEFELLQHEDPNEQNSHHTNERESHKYSQHRNIWKEELWQFNILCSLGKKWLKWIIFTVILRRCFTICQPRTKLVVETTFRHICRRPSFWPNYRTKHGRWSEKENNIFCNSMVSMSCLIKTKQMYR